ncbi:LysM peptidoglycan-binding domain-containing protein [Pseudactinotalea terrae]|uniref:LysM peptidoglycan-binding domain-containing protein n=1 Tax=Pseudactinotalea terrae TaxID=1743262 RepID=UPI0012E2B72D|nr:LysM peptidoglycan-binding domain-containing protein [Pseudactinotalea terrae]
MSVLAHPGPISFPLPRRRHLTVVPALPDVTPEPERFAEVIDLPVPQARPAGPTTARPAVSRPAVADAPLRLTNRGRAVLAGLAIALAAVVGSVAGAAMGTPASAGGLEVVTVKSGDSLWSIAAAAAAPGEDVRDLMSEIVELNGLQGATLVAGQELTVPAGD